MPETTQTPVVDTIAAMTAESLVRCNLAPDELVLVRLAALAAIDAPPISYLAHVGVAVESGVTLERVQDLLVAIAPIIGTARTMSAGVNITEVLGVVVAVAEEALAEGGA